MTNTHHDRIRKDGKDKGYSIRVGKTLPKQSANLGYVQTEEASPTNNIFVESFSDKIPENKEIYQVSEQIMVPNDNFLLQDEEGKSELPSNRISITDEFTVPRYHQDEPKPLYYKMTLKGFMNGKGAPVIPYYQGYMATPPSRTYSHNELNVRDREHLLYMGAKLSITTLNGDNIPEDCRFKVEWISEEGESVPENAYRVNVYTNFKNTPENTYVIHYEMYDKEGHLKPETIEILRAQPFFEEVDASRIEELQSNPKDGQGWKEEIFEKIYTVKQKQNQNFEAYAPSQVIVADYKTRPGHTFKYRIQGELETRFTPENAGELKIGIAYINESVIGVENIEGSLWKIYNDAEFRPQYLEMLNPNPPQLSLLKDNPTYWRVDLNMPREKYMDYDVLIITGYGRFDLTPFNESLQAYLETGGTLWIDNGGGGDQVLRFENLKNEKTSFFPFTFSQVNNTGYKKIGKSPIAMDIARRLYLTDGQIKGLGYDGVNAKINFDIGEGEEWSHLISYEDNTPSVMHKQFYEKGNMFVSNCGIWRALFLEEQVDHQYAMNTLLWMAEHRVLITPWIQEHVYHRDNLFLQEYKDEKGNVLYIDGQDDEDSTTVVAKKQIASTIKEKMYPYLPSYFRYHEGNYEIEVMSDKEIAVINPDFEVGTIVNGNPVSEWTVNTEDAIPGWRVRKIAGGAVTYKHELKGGQIGFKSVSMATTEGAHAFWSQTLQNIPSGTYKVEAWLKSKDVQAVTTNGAKIGFFNDKGELLGASPFLIGTKEWTKVKVICTINTAANIEVRIGFVDGNGKGTIYADFVKVSSVGSVRSTPKGSGRRPLYMYAKTPKEESMNLQSEGFQQVDVAKYYPALECTFTIRSYVFSRDARGRFIRETGNYETYKRKISKADGVVSFGSLMELLPALPDGAKWADKNRVYYEVFLGGEGSDTSNQYINLSLYNKETGDSYYSKEGEWLISHNDLYYNDWKPHIIVQASTDYYTIGATKRRYSISTKDGGQIFVEAPKANDSRDNWSLRIHNGSFIKQNLGYSELKALYKNKEAYDRYESRLFGWQYYKIPEYDRQVFHFQKGYREKKQEAALYLDDRTIQVSHAPIVIREGVINGELLRSYDKEHKIFTAENGKWKKSFKVVVYVDENKDGNYIIWREGFDIDYEYGYVIFENPVQGLVKVDYAYDNLAVYRRRYYNQSEKDIHLYTTDRKTFRSPRKGWLPFPTPRVYAGIDRALLPSTAYTIDFEEGAVIFPTDQYDFVYADFSFAEHDEVEILDVDTENGRIYLKDPISFKDEIFVNYMYEENFYEYNGYFDEVLGRFFHLDFNPLPGHVSTLPVKKKDGDKEYVVYEKVPSVKLLNKDIFVYVLPYHDGFGMYRSHTVRHCFTQEEWEHVQQMNPRALLLAIVHVREHTRVQDTIVMDARVRGGGLKPSISNQQIKATQPDGLSHWDMGTWDGEAYNQQGVIVIRIPKKVLQEHGGQFTEGQVREIVDQHRALGVYPIIEFIEEE